MTIDCAINLTFAHAVTVLMRACRVADGARPAFEARLRQLQRLGVPQPGASEVKKRLDYGLPELAALATAMRLMDAFMVPTLAARYVIERWSELAPMLLAGAADALPPAWRVRRPLSVGPIALFVGNALGEMGRKGRHEERYDGPLGTVVFLSDQDAVGLVSAVGGAGIVLDSRSYMPSLIEHIAQIGMPTEAELAFELDRIRFAT